jgi:GNAT superfamily N-acetyltransferase
MIDVPPEDPAMAEDVGPLIRALRSSLTAAEFARFADAASRQGLVFTAAYRDSGPCVGVATHRVLETSRGRLLFVDDLVVDDRFRSQGIGGQLMAELENRARASGCDRIELDTGVANKGAHRFYHEQRMSIMAIHFGRELT